ncbi:hypothetical protein [Umezakia ovalisporum]|uniref:Uncharacterized protein n=1 Tax=Umezakia ovalisporum FSS-43 TaxID=2740520 RepID=A0ABT6K2R5_9CYAN|nr:hypothetical protein [Umezakia ovalisporum]MDH6056638.1 hypothetical protein [Umezakia ovalisporum FSS-43]MDH6075944.1 hypothetical protein [Umezakia ovalisporum CS-1034]MDH6079909.1 hypothetical protein [Umezakia ovalisporum FSS-44]MDH6087772.1 hypothetical protein [Umezakia ovalisporum Ak1311]
MTMTIVISIPPPRLLEIREIRNALAPLSLSEEVQQDKILI